MITVRDDQYEYLCFNGSFHVLKDVRAANYMYVSEGFYLHVNEEGKILCRILLRTDGSLAPTDSKRNSLDCANKWLDVLRRMSDASSPHKVVNVKFG